MLKNQKRMREFGINYPHAGKGHPGNGADLNILTRSWINRHTERYHTLILSHEDLFALPYNGIRLQNMDICVQVVAFVRPFSDWLVADFSQTLKQYLNGTLQTLPNNFQSFVRAREAKIIPSQFLSDWQDLFPRVPLNVDHHRNIKRSMIRFAPALDKIDWKIPDWRCNRSMTIEQSMDVHRAIQLNDLEQANRIATLRYKSTNGHPPLNSAHFEAEEAALRDTWNLDL